MRRALTLAGLTLVHAVASLAAMLWSYSVSSVAFEGRPVPWLARHLAGPLEQVLWFPLVLFTRTAVQGVETAPWLQYMLVLGNSALWALAASWSWARWQQRKGG
jgi:hypothetical protein